GRRQQEPAPRLPEGVGLLDKGIVPAVPQSRPVIARCAPILTMPAAVARPMPEVPPALRNVLPAMQPEPVSSMPEPASHPTPAPRGAVIKFALGGPSSCRRLHGGLPSVGLGLEPLS